MTQLTTLGDGLYADIGYVSPNLDDVPIGYLNDALTGSDPAFQANIPNLAAPADAPPVSAGVTYVPYIPGIVHEEPHPEPVHPTPEPGYALLLPALLLWALFTGRKA